MTKVFGKLTYLQISVLIFGLVAAGLITGGFEDEEFLLILGLFIGLGILQIIFTQKTLGLLKHPKFHEVAVIDDMLSFKNNSLMENKLYVKIIGVLLIIAYIILLVLMCVLIDELLWRMEGIWEAVVPLSEREIRTSILFYGTLISFPLIVITIWYNLNMFKTKRIVTDDSE